MQTKMVIALVGWQNNPLVHVNHSSLRIDSFLVVFFSLHFVESRQNCATNEGVSRLRGVSRCLRFIFGESIWPSRHWLATFHHWSSRGYFDTGWHTNHRCVACGCMSAQTTPSTTTTQVHLTDIHSNASNSTG